MLLRRRHRLRNNTNRIIYLREALHGKGYYTHETRLDPYSIRDDFPATVYRNHNREFGLPSKIVIFVGKDEALRGLISEEFVQYVELIFEMDEGTNKLIVYGIPAQLTDYFPFRYIPLVRTLHHLPNSQRLSYLRKHFTKSDYSGRPREVVNVSRFKVRSGPPDDMSAKIVETSQSTLYCREPKTLTLDAINNMCEVRKKRINCGIGSQAPVIYPGELSGGHRRGTTFVSAAQVVAQARVNELTRDNKALRGRISSLEEQVSYLMANVIRQQRP